MGIKCPKCGSRNTNALGPGKMLCNSCSNFWKPYKHRGKKMKIVGDDLIYPKRKIMPGSKTRIIGDNIIWPKERVKKVKEKKNIFGW